MFPKKNDVCLFESYMNFVRGETPRSLWRFLVPASWIGRFWVGAVDRLYRHGLKRTPEPSIPLISVGNLTYGGTNKTPFVEMLCRMMRAKDIPVGIVSRGYGGDNPDVLLIESGKNCRGETADRRSVGDEPLLLSSRLPGVPVAVSRDRMKGLLELQRKGVILGVADDAFQHRRLGRDVDVVLIDASCPFGNGYLIPAGILREPLTALRRAHIVVLTKVEQLDPAGLDKLRKKVAEYVDEDRIFSARLAVVEWALWEGSASGFRPFGGDMKERKLMAFSAIGNPGSFIRSLRREGADVVAERHFRDHHSYTEADMREIEGQMRCCGAEFLACTEKDIHNLPADWRGAEPLLVPRIATVLDEPGRFTEVLADCLRPRIVVASNGYGEDAIGVLLAEKMRRAFPSGEIWAFPLVGRGEPYRNRGFFVASTPSVTPSGGVLKYRLRDLWGDIRAGLFSHIRDQQRAWRQIAHRVRTPVCVGDVYLLLHTLWGQGTAPLFVATAKTVYLGGHWRLERAIIRRYCRRTWTRDQDSAGQLSFSGADAVYAGSPIMDLLGDVRIAPPSLPDPEEAPLIMLLPGSRERAYDDVSLLLGAVEILQERKSCDYVMVLAATLSLSRLVEACKGWLLEEDEDFWLTQGNIRIRLHQGEVASAAAGVHLLIGLGGTANQLCAGVGIPVVSIDEKGKRVQKKLLGDSEILVDSAPRDLADCALKILTTPELYRKMSDAGRMRMGRPGALDDVVRYAGEELGWKVRCEVYEKTRSSSPKNECGQMSS